MGEMKREWYLFERRGFESKCEVGSAQDVEGEGLFWSAVIGQLYKQTHCCQPQGYSA